MYKIVFRFVYIWHFYCIMSSALVFYRTQCMRQSFKVITISDWHFTRCPYAQTNSSVLEHPQNVYSRHPKVDSPTKSQTELWKGWHAMDKISQFCHSIKMTDKNRLGIDTEHISFLPIKLANFFTLVNIFCLHYRKVCLEIRQVFILVIFC